MSQSFRQSLSSFSNNGYERSMAEKQPTDWMLRMQNFEPLPPGQLDLGGGQPSVYEAGGGLREIMDLPWQKEALDDQIQSSYRWPQKQHLSANEPVNELPLMNPHVKVSVPPPLRYLKKSVPISLHSNLQGLQLVNPVSAPSLEAVSQVTWIPGAPTGSYDHTVRNGTIIEGQGLSLSLSPSLRNLEAARFEKMSLGHGELYLHGQEIGPSSHNPYGLKDFGANQQMFHSSLSHNVLSDTDNQFRFGLMGSSRSFNVVRNSRYLKATQELLEEFCSVWRGHMKNQRTKTQDRNPNSTLDGGGDAAAGPSSSKDHHPLSPTERSEYQKRKIKLMAMLDEVCTPLFSLLPSQRKNLQNNFGLTNLVL